MILRDIKVNSNSGKGIEQTEKKEKCQYNKMSGNFLKGYILVVLRKIRTERLEAGKGSRMMCI